MTRLLHISASPRSEASESLALAETFLETYQNINPNVEVENWNLWDGDLPEFGPSAAAAEMAVFAGADLDSDEAAAWRDVIATFERFDSADRYLFSVPMWNASVPYILKQLIDVISQPGMMQAGIRNLPGAVILGGGLVVESGGSLVGAIGVSGAPGGDADEACAKAGIDAVQAKLDF